MWRKGFYTVSMPVSRPETLDFPFFTLEYRDGVFARLIPADARDLGGGLFRQKGKTWKLPDDENRAALAEPLIQGRPLLALLTRLPNPLIQNGPRLARDGERLMELSLAVTASAPLAAGEAGAGPLVLELRRLIPDAGGEWLPLRGLPHHRVCQNIIYEIIDEETLREFAGPHGGRHGGGRYTLRGEDIPRFADAQGRLVFRFGDQRLKALLADDSVFVQPERLSLVLGAAREKGGGGGRFAAPFLRYGDSRYPAEEVSRRMDRDYILLDRQWARREDLAAAGLLPLFCYSGGRAIEQVRLKPGELLRRGSERLAGGRFAGLFGDLELDTDLWLERGSAEDIFHAHLEFLLAWGLSGGVAANGHREQAARLCALLERLAASGANVLALMEKRYYELYLPPLLPGLQAANITLPGVSRKSSGAPVRIALYEDLPQSPMEQRSALDVLALVEPEEALPREQTITHLQNIRAEVTLGVFSDAGELFRGPLAAKARNLFGVTEAELLPYLIRNTARPLSLPRFVFPPPRILRPQEGLPLTCAVEEKFAGLSGPALYTELALFQAGGPPAPFVPLRLLKGSLDIERMDDAERAFFVYWRGEFRRGNIIKTGESYIRVYARELCLFSGGEAGAEGNFRELFRLWKTYREVFDSLNGFLPRWLADFAVVYEIADNALPLLAPCAKECGDSLLADLYLYRRFINENNAVEFDDIALLIPETIRGGVFFNDGSAFGDSDFSVHRQRLIKDLETVVNAVDRFLRERFRLRLFEFFYPQVYDAEKREAFADMERSGRSSYTAVGIRFSKHPPLIDFLEKIFRYTEYRFKLKNGLELKGREPPLEAAWKQIADSALGLEDLALIPRAAMPPAGPPEPVYSVRGAAAATPVPVARRTIALGEGRLAKLRADSDAVRDLLRTEDESEGREPARRDAPPMPAKKTAGENSLSGFITGLGAAERETLRRIAANPPALNAELRTLARENHTMPELIIDKINAAFLEAFNDLLIGTVDEQPRIQPEYIRALKKMWGGTC